MNVGFISLGCDKNRVDAEKMLCRLSEAGYEIVPDKEEADVLLINTCAFIEAAKREAIDAIMDAIELKKRKKDLKILERFPVPAEISGMIQLTHIQDWFYITVSTDLTGNQDYATILRIQDLNDLSSGSWEDIYDNFVGGGTPYYISSFDGHYYLTEHRIPGHSVWQFDVIDNALTDIRALF